MKNENPFQWNKLQTKKMNSALRQVWVTMGTLLNLVAAGFNFGFPTILLRDLRAPGSDIPASLEAQSWITSAIAITTLPSILLCAFVLQKFGRKPAHFCIVVPGIIHCLLLYFAQDVTTLVIARLVSGFTNGPTIIVAAIVIGEYSSPEYRGVFLASKNAATTVGILYAHVVGTFFDWRMTALFGLIPTVLSFLITCTWPESPSWLALKGKYEDCEKSFVWLRGHNIKDKEELLILIQTQRNCRLNKITESSPINKVKGMLAKLKRKDFQQPTWIVLFIFIIMEACGRHSFPAYAIKFMSAFSKDSSTILYYVLAVDVVIVLASVGSCGVVKLFPRRTLLFASGGLSCTLLTSICTYLYLKSQHIASENNVWLPLLLLCLYFIVLNLGTSSMALCLLGEIYPLEHRGLGTVVTGIWNSLSLLITLKVTPALIRTIEVHGTFLIYMMFMAGSLVYLYFFLPETEGKTLQEIEHYFNGVPLKLVRDNEEALLDGEQADRIDNSSHNV